MSDNQNTDSTNDGKKRSMNPLNKIPKPGGSKFNFNFYWIYAILFIVIIAIQFLGVGNKPREITWNQFETEMLKTNDVAEFEVINKERVNIYIKKDKLQEDKYKPVASKTFSNAVNEGPHFYFTIGDVGSFEKKLEDAQIANPEAEKISVSYNNNDKSYWDFISQFVQLSYWYLCGYFSCAEWAAEVVEVRFSISENQRQHSLIKICM